MASLIPSVRKKVLRDSGIKRRIKGAELKELEKNETTAVETNKRSAMLITIRISPRKTKALEITPFFLTVL